MSRKFRGGEWFLNVGDKNFISALALETMQLVFESSSVILDECHDYPSLMMNIVSVGLLAKLGFKFFNKR